MSKKFPKTIYVEHEQDVNGDETWLHAGESMKDVSPEVGKSKTVAVYSFVRLAKLCAAVRESK